MGKLHLLWGIYEEHYKHIQEKHNKNSMQDQQQYIQITNIRKTNKWKFKWRIKTFMQHMQSCIYRSNWSRSVYDIRNSSDISKLTTLSQLMP